MAYTPVMGRKPLGKERINISLARGVPDAMMEAAKLLGKDRSDLIGDLCREYLKKNPVATKPKAKAPR